MCSNQAIAGACDRWGLAQARASWRAVTGRRTPAARRWRGSRGARHDSLDVRRVERRAIAPETPPLTMDFDAFLSIVLVPTFLNVCRCRPGTTHFIVKSSARTCPHRPLLQLCTSPRHAPSLPCVLVIRRAATRERVSCYDNEKSKLLSLFWAFWGGIGLLFRVRILFLSKVYL